MTSNNETNGITITNDPEWSRKKLKNKMYILEKITHPRKKEKVRHTKPKRRK